MLHVLKGLTRNPQVEGKVGDDLDQHPNVFLVEVAVAERLNLRGFSIFVSVVSKGCTPGGSPPFQKSTVNLNEVAWDYLKRAARIDELNGHLPDSDGQMVAALKRFNGGRARVFVFCGAVGGREPHL